MFTGIVETTGRLSSSQPRSSNQGDTTLLQLVVVPAAPLPCKIGDSISVNGCCLTVVAHQDQGLLFDVSGETLAKTNLGNLALNAEVNLERAMALGDRLGGHLVSGHVDGAAKVTSVLKATDGWQIRFAVPRSLGKYLISKGSVCLDGISLTVNSVEDLGSSQTEFSVTLIPTTLALTTMHHIEYGQTLNVEVDLLGKYVERLLENRPNQPVADKG